VKRYLPWVVGTVGAVLYFVIFETLAFRDPEHWATLSNAVATVGLRWPLAIFLMGFFAGGLSVHFFWPWKKNPLGDGGG
jgi:hypothetical protein